MKRSTLVALPVAVAFAGCGGMEMTDQNTLGRGGGGLIGDTTSLTQITIDCGDGFPTVATVDDDTLQAVQDSLQAMIDNPAGLLCTLTTSPVVISTTGLLRADRSTAVTSSNGNSGPFATGGGQYLSPDRCYLSFGFSAHNEQNPQSPDDTTFARGSVVWDSSNGANQPDPSCTSGHVKIDVTCLATVATSESTMPAAAQIVGLVTHATGMFSDFAPGTSFCQSNGVVMDGVSYCVAQTDVTDAQKTGNPDTISQAPVIPDEGSANGPNPYSCAAPTVPQQPLKSGNINIEAN